MDIAWPAVAILVMILPGFSFFVGLYSRELYGREAASGDAVSKLAPIVLVSFLVHSGMTIVIHIVPWIPDVDLRAFLSAVNLDSAESIGLTALASNLAHNVGWILLYISVSSGLGAVAGWYVAGKIIDGKLRFGVAHPWAYDLSTSSNRRIDPTFAFVLTKIRRGTANELYKGPLDRFGLHPDGRFSYLVLLQPQKSHVERDADGTTKKFYWREIGDWSGKTAGKRLLYFDMKEVANVVLERYPGITGITSSRLSSALASRRAESS